MKRELLLLALIVLTAAVAIAVGLGHAQAQSIEAPTLLVEQLDGDVTEACGLTLVLRAHVDEPHVIALTVCPLFRDGFEP